MFSGAVVRCLLFFFFEKIWIIQNKALSLYQERINMENKRTYQIWSDDGKTWHITDTSNTIHMFYAWLETSKVELKEMEEEI